MSRLGTIATLGAAAALFLAACAPTIQASDPFLDSRLDCQQLAIEITRTRELRAEAQSNTGMSGQNVAWALVFWPAIFANESSNADAIRAADDRLRYLYVYYEDRECNTLGLLAPTNTSSASPVRTNN